MANEGRAGQAGAEEERASQGGAVEGRAGQVGVVEERASESAARCQSRRPALVVWSLDDRVGVVTVRYRQVACIRRRLVPRLVPRKSIMLEHSNEVTHLAATLEPPIGIEPMT